MPLWTKTSNSAGAPKWRNVLASNTARGNTLYANTTPGAFTNNLAVGVFGVDVGTANTYSNISLNAGWTLVKKGTGPVATVQVTNNGASFANGEFIIFSNGLVNATAFAVTNTSGNLVGTTLGSGGSGFVNTYSTVVTFGRQKHLNNLTVSVGGTTYSNSDYIVASNAISNGVANLTTNSLGGITATTLTNVGLWGSAVVNTNVTFAIYQASGAASLGSGATLAANLTTSTSGNVSFTLGGRSGRLQYETLACAGLTNDAGNPFPKA